jgi:hypothetical protein
MTAIQFDGTVRSVWAALLIVGNGLKYPLILPESKRVRAIIHRGTLKAHKKPWGGACVFCVKGGRMSGNPK